METSKKFFGVLTLIIPFLITVWTQVGTSFVLEGKTLISQSVISTAENDAREALRDTLYYRFEPWVREFQEKIAELERSKHSFENQLEQMKYYFFLAQLLN